MSEQDLQVLVDRLRDFAQRRDWEQFHSPKNLSMALTVEASELLEHFQWMSEEQSENLSAQQKRLIELEMADIFIFLLRLVDRLDVDLLAVTREKMAINEKLVSPEEVLKRLKKSTLWPT